MGKNNEQTLKFAESFLGERGARFRSFCGMRSGAWCDAFMTYVMHKSGNKALFCNGKKQTSCPITIKWCYKNLACVPIYLAMPGDFIFFDWEPNGTPNHIGMVREHISCDEIYTVEGNTSGGIVANKKRVREGKKNRKTVEYIQAVFRPHYPASYTIGTLKVDGIMGYSTIANLQKWLGVEVDGILGQKTLKALQKFLGVKQDAIWGTATSKALQRVTGTTADGLFGKNSVKALQKWLNAQNAPVVKTETKGDKIAKTAQSYVGKVQYKKGGTSLKTGCDCTGFVQAIYKLHGIDLKNTDLVKKGSLIKSINNAKPGDIINYHKNGSSHHGIYIGNGKIVHAANAKKDVCISKWDSVSLPLKNIRRAWK